jgi:hypothetical protein|tara:strand:+ start:351 stop:596 length:246 start_codon:yes stop_codon:yes gene_type:complete
MKITKSRLKQIIKEEMKKILNEKLEPGDKVTHKDHEDWGTGTVRAIRKQKKGDAGVGGSNVLVQWENGSRETVEDRLEKKS